MFHEQRIKEFSIEDNELVKNILSEGREAYAHLVRRHHLKVIGVCRAFLHDEASAEDAAQETFLKAYSDLKPFRGDASFGTWVYRIAVNLCKDRLRQCHRQKAESLEALLEENRAELNRLFDPSFEGVLENRDLAERILNALPEAYRDVLLMREINGFSYQEIAETLDITEDAVKARLKRARADLIEKFRHFSDPTNVQ